MIEEPKVFSTAYLMGGLGNQMFQIAHAVCQGLENNVPALFKCEAYTPLQAYKPTKYVDNIFRNINFVDYKSKVKRVSFPWQFTQTNLIWDSPVEFYGYFQSSKNFKGFGDKIVDLFSPTNEFIEKLKSLYPKIFEKDSVSIHVRRGDYLNIPEILPTIDKSYFDYCLSKLNYKHIFLFSDDKMWLENNMNYENTTIVYNLEDYEEIWAISLCNHNIMSNSSFSWWGSYLNKNEDKKVFAPSIWFGPSGEKNYEDIYCENWNKINVDYVNGKIVCF